MDRKLRFQLLFGSTQMVGFVAKLTILHIIYIYMYREREIYIVLMRVKQVFSVNALYSQKVAGAERVIP